MGHGDGARKGQAGKATHVHGGKYEWLGYWEELEFTTSWQRYSAHVPLPSTRHGHPLDVSFVMGAHTGIYLIDDVTVELFRTPPPAPMPPAAGAAPPPPTPMPRICARRA